MSRIAGLTDSLGEVRADDARGEGLTHARRRRTLLARRAVGVEGLRRGAWYHRSVRRKHRNTLAAIFKRPTQGGIRWDDIESLLLACGVAIEERAGSRMYIELNGVAAHFHRPHPSKEARKGMVEATRRFLDEAGVKP